MSQVKSLLGIIALAAAFFGCAAVLGETVTFEGVSMLPALKDGERIRVERFDRGAKFEVKRGDIVMFLYPGDPSKFYVKRLIGLPTETIEAREGKIIIDGHELSEPYVDPQLNLSKLTQPPLFVKEHYYYVLGDNRDHSSDSRSWGLVPEKYILGRVISK